MGHISQRILLLIVMQVTNKNSSSERDITPPYIKQFIHHACSVCTVKYRASFFSVQTLLSALAWSLIKTQCDILQCRSHTRSIILYYFFLFVSGRNPSLCCNLIGYSGGGILRYLDRGPKVIFFDD